MLKSRTPRISALENQNPRDTGSVDAPEKQMPTRCAIYTRVSTDQQAEVEYSSCEAQEDRVRSFINSQVGFVVAKVYSDPGFTGANMDRPALQRLAADVAAGLLDMVVTYKIDRLTRSPRDFYQLVEHLDAHNVGFISVTERFDTSTPSGRLLRNIMLTFAQFERELISERVRDKLVQRVKRGLHGVGTPPYGYVSDKGVLVFDPPRDQHVRLVFETYVKTRSIRAILRVLKEKGIVSRKGKPFCDSAIWNMLRNKVYMGQIVHRDTVYPGKHEPIISPELFNNIQRLIAESPGLPPNPENHLPFAGLVRCQECGTTMSVAFTKKQSRTGWRKYFYYRCGSVGHHGREACRTKQIGADRLHDLVYRNLVRLSVDTENLKNLVFSLQNRTRPTLGEGFKPLQDFRQLTPEMLQKDLTAYVKSCARKTGIEKVYAMRKGIGRIHYSKKSVRVDYAFGQFSGALRSGQAGGEGGFSGPVSNEKERIQPGGSALAKDGANRSGSPVSAPVLDREGTVRPCFDSAPAPTKRPNGFGPLSLSTPGGGFSKYGVFKF
jgi:site-specific DNA recombinase